ncbi:MAG: septal ring lytic transglycosylase RlpA family protein [Hyphomicrobium sp.]|nr:septal ring lytic transglycosylase RlpA family protein [Hyphomicrobium sp.]
MRTYMFSALGALSLVLLTLSPASAENAAWTCMSPAFACGGAPVAKAHKSYEYTGERSKRRQASAKRKSPRIAKHERVKENAPKHVETKIDLPEKKQRQAAVAPSDAKAPVLEKKPEIAERTVETEKTYRVTGTQSGMASYYWQGQMTASGARFNPNAMTAAHRNLPFGTKVRVTNKRNGKTVIVTINDRGPFIRGRIIDLSNAAAGIIGMRSAGVAPVTVERIAAN